MDLGGTKMLREVYDLLKAQKADFQISDATCQIRDVIDKACLDEIFGKK